MLSFQQSANKMQRRGPESQEHAAAGTYLAGGKEGTSRHAKRTCLPITPVVLERLRSVWNQDPTNHDHVMLWAVCCVGVFGFLRSGELSAPDSGEFDPSQHLTFN